MMSIITKMYVKLIMFVQVSKTINSSITNNLSTYNVLPTSYLPK